MGAQHFVRHEEEEAFADWINKRLLTDKDVIHFLPLAVMTLKNSVIIRLAVICGQIDPGL